MKMLHYRPRPRIGQAYHTTGYGCSLENIREVWAAASYLYLSNGGFSIRGILATSKVSSTCVVGAALRVLVEMGYIGRGSRYMARTWYVIVPLFETKDVK